MNPVTAALLGDNGPQPTAGQRQRLMPLRGAVCVLDVDEEAILRLIDQGDLAWVWNIALQPERARKKTLRILPQCLNDYHAGRKCGLQQWADVVALLLPGPEQSVPIVETERLLNASQAHIAALVRRKEILLCTRGRRGRGGAAHVWKYSVARFLQRRLFPLPVAET